jgi:hypothetical protein
MKTNRISWALASAPFIATSLFFAYGGPDGKAPVAGGAAGMRTSKDLLGAYGETFNHRRAHSGKIAKLDVDGDFNYDGVIDNNDPADNGLVQSEGAGLVLGVGELSRLAIRLSPYQQDVTTRVRFELEVTGINRAIKTGAFNSLEEENASVGRIRVWADAGRKQLLLDSAHGDRRVWSVEMDNLLPDTILNSVPRAVYVEGISPSGQYLGDLRLLARIIDVRADSAAQKRGLFSKLAGVGFRPSFDHILLTVQSYPHKKAYVNNNAEGIWSK